MSTAQNKAIVRRMYEVDYSQGLEQTFKKLKAEFFSTEFISHTPEGDMSFDNFIKVVGTLFKAFPDLKFTLDDLIAEGDKVSARYTMSGIHKGKFQGIPATGKKIKINGLEIRRMDGGKFVEYWGIMDNFGMMQQLGAMPKS